MKKSERIAELEAEVDRLNSELDKERCGASMSREAILCAREALGEYDRPFLEDSVRVLKDELEEWREFGKVFEEGMSIITSILTEVADMRDLYYDLWQVTEADLDAADRDIEVLESLLIGAYRDIAVLDQKLADTERAYWDRVAEVRDRDRVVDSMYDAAKDVVAVYDDALLEGLI